MSTNRIILNETSYFGPGSREVLISEIKARNFRKVLLVTDKDLVKFGVAGKITALLEKGGIKPENAIERFKAAAEKEGAAPALKASFDGCLPLIAKESEEEKRAAFEHCEILVGAVLSGYAEETDGQEDALSEERILTRVAAYVYSRQDRRKNKE